ncbi:hypothetical protein T492DRAFT_1111150 [Pavlovales sp. CCMP2436]|nr:hypothetical protein T492DRAFT_1111150 [Pavlovales sp. CCMP2436]
MPTRSSLRAPPPAASPPAAALAARKRGRGSVKDGAKPRAKLPATPAQGAAGSRPDTPSLFGQCLLAVAEADRQAAAPLSHHAPLALSVPQAAEEPSSPRRALAGAFKLAAPASDQGQAAEEPPSPRRALACAFKLNTHPSAAEVSALAAFLELTSERVASWYERRWQLEVWALDMAKEQAQELASRDPRGRSGACAA